MTSSDTEMLSASEWESRVEGDFPVHKAVVKAMPKGTRVFYAAHHGISSWAKTAKIEVILPSRRTQKYFLKCATGQSAEAIVHGEFESAAAINSVVPNMVAKPFAWGQYQDGESHVYFLLSDFHDMDFIRAPDAESFTSKLAELHQKGTSPNGMFGFPIPTVCGRMERTVTWHTSWAKSFDDQLKDVIKYENGANGPWPEYDAACKQMLKVVVPRLLGALQSGGRNIRPALIHGDLWENNVGRDKESRHTIIFDPGSMYAHNEMEFGMWRCSWAVYFNSPMYLEFYQQHVKPSEPAEEWDDRNRLYGIHSYLIESGGHPGSVSRQFAYNDMLYLCEKYGPLDSLEKYDPEKDISVAGVYFAVKSLK